MVCFEEVDDLTAKGHVAQHVVRALGIRLSEVVVVAQNVGSGLLSRETRPSAHKCERELPCAIITTIIHVRGLESPNVERLAQRVPHIGIQGTRMVVLDALKFLDCRCRPRAFSG